MPRRHPARVLIGGLVALIMSTGLVAVAPAPAAPTPAVATELAAAGQDPGPVVRSDTAQVGSSRSAEVEIAPAAAPPPVAQCTPTPLATWRQPLPVAADRGASESDCYAVTSAAAGTYLWRMTRASTEFRPVLEIYREDGTRALNVTWGGGYGQVTLVAGQTYRILVSGVAPSGASGYRLGLYSLLGGSCPTQGSTGFAATGIQDSFSGGELHCRELSMATGARVLATNRAVSPVSTVVYRPAGSACSWERTTVVCALTGSGPFRMITRSGSSAVDATGTSYEAWVDDTTGGQGCGAGTLTPWRAAPAITAQRGRGQAECFLVSASTTGRHVIEVSQAGNWQSTVRVFDPAGTQPLVSGSGVVTLNAGTTYRMVVSGPPQPQPASYGVTLTQLDDAVGCRPVAADSWTADATSVSFPVGTEIDCLEFDEPPGGTLRIAVTDASSPVTASLFGASSVTSCLVSTQSRDCALTGTGPYRLVVRAGTATVHPPATAAVWATNYAATDGCPTVPLATWSQPLPVDLVRSGRPVDCRRVVTQTAGTHLLRSERETPSGLTDESSVDVHAADGTRVARGSASTGIWPYQLAAGTEYRVILHGTPGLSMRVGLHQLATACPAVADTTWDAEPTQPGFAEGSETDCRVLPGVEGTSLRVSLESTSDPDTTVSGSAYDADGRVICRLDVAVRFCPLDGPGPYRLLTTTRVPETPDLWAHDLATDDGCRSLGATSSMSAAAVRATLPANRVVTCWTSPTVSGDRMWLSVAKDDPDSPGATPTAQFIGPDGILGETGIRALCETSAVAHRCDPVDVGSHRVLVSGGPFADADYRLALRRLNQPQGCEFTRAVAQSLPVTTGRLDQPDDLRCLQIPANPGDTWRFSAANPEQAADNGHRVHVYAPDGALLCTQPAAAPCVATSVGHHAVVVATGSVPGPFELRGTCLTPACGDESLLLESVTPDGVPPIKGAALTLRGRGLGTALTVRLEQETTTRTATPLSAPADGTELDVSVDLSGASGTWDVVVEEVGSPEQRLDGAVTIEPWVAPEVTAELVTRGVYSPGRFTTFAVELDNPGNVPVIGLPLVLRGLPEGTELVPLFPMSGLPGALGTRGHVPPPPPQDPPLPPRDPDLPLDVVPDPGTPGTGTTIIVIDKVPAKGTRTLKFKAKAPADGSRSSYEIQAGIPPCDTAPGSSPLSLWDGASKCVEGIADVALGAIANVVPIPCAGEVISGGKALFKRMAGFGGGSASFQMSDMTDVLKSIVSCGASLVGPPVLNAAIGLVSSIDGVVGAVQSCLDWWKSAMDSVSAIDPNELAGPSGGGPDRAISGKGRHTFAVYFENLATATAPAQEVRIAHHLDPAQYDLSTVQFSTVAFGERSWDPAVPTDALDDVLSLGDGLQLDVEASVDPAGDLLWRLMTQDVATGDYPDDPLVGFLPPNVDGTEGQGAVWVSVEPRQHPDGTVLSSVADIWFDLNAPIRTNTWTNLVDTTAPTAALTTPGSATGSFPVSWSGTDATSGVATMDVLVSVDGAPAVAWRRGVEPGSATYAGSAGRTYRFTAIARDHAGLTGARATATTTVTGPGPRRPPPVIAPLVSQLQVKARSPRRGLAVLRLAVVAGGQNVRGAELVIRDKGRTVRVTLAKGAGKVRLRRLAAGRHRIKIVFAGTRTVAPARAKVVVRVK